MADIVDKVLNKDKNYNNAVSFVTSKQIKIDILKNKKINLLVEYTQLNLTSKISITSIPLTKLSNFIASTILNSHVPNKPVKSLDPSDGNFNNDEHKQLMEEEEALTEKFKELQKRRSDIKLVSERVANNLIILINKYERAISPIKDDKRDTMYISAEFKAFDNKAKKIKTSYANYLKHLQSRIDEVFLTVFYKYLIILMFMYFYSVIKKTT